MIVRITIACPEHLIADANQFALCVGNAPADARTFRSATWEDGEGAKYALTSLLAGSQFSKAAAAPLRAPDHALDVNLVAAARAQGALQIWSPLSTGSFPTLGPETLIAVIGLDASVAVPLLGLSPVPTEE